MANCFRTRLARYEWSDYPAVRISPSPTKHSKVTSAVKKESQTWTFRPKSSAPPQVYVRKTVSINGDFLKGRDVPREYETWSSLGSHPYVLACEDFQCMANAYALDEATFWSEYCEMGDLGQFVMLDGSKHKSLSFYQAEQVVYQISSALAFIHHGLYITLDDYGSVEELELFDHVTLMHRDIKPQNIFISCLDPANGKIHVRLGDFGCAKQLDDDTSMSDTGTIRYKAPESRCTSPSGKIQKPNTSIKSDIWSFGATMRDITIDLPDFCHQCCQEDPVKRPASVTILEDLYQQTQREQDVSSFVVEALRKDSYSTFWDYALIERILEAGAIPKLVGPTAIAAVQLMVNTSDKTLKDTEAVCQLLSSYKVFSSIGPSMIIDDQSNINLDKRLFAPNDTFSRNSKDMEFVQLLSNHEICSKSWLATLTDDHASLPPRGQSSNFVLPLHTPSSSSDHNQTFVSARAEMELTGQPARGIVQVAAQDHTDLDSHVRPGVEGLGGGILTSNPEPDLAFERDINSSISLRSTGHKAGHDMPKIQACWYCVLQRDRCGPGDTCERCLKRSQRPDANLSLDCVRTKLVELISDFQPSCAMLMHEEGALKDLVSKHIVQWGHEETTYYLSFSPNKLPYIIEKLYGFVPSKQGLTGCSQKTDIVSPPYAMMHINHDRERIYDSYLSELVDYHSHRFSGLCWEEEEERFLEKVFRLMVDLRPNIDDETELAREVLRLVVCTFCMFHALGSKPYRQGQPVVHFTLPHLLHRQLQQIFARLQRSIMDIVLNKLQQILRTSRGHRMWILAFVAVLGLAMANEMQQKKLYLTQQVRVRTENISEQNAFAVARAACAEIDSKMSFIFLLFRTKYNRRYNPIANNHKLQNRGANQLIRELQELIGDNFDFLRSRMKVEHELRFNDANINKYSSRLVGEFLLSFWLPA